MVRSFAALVACSLVVPGSQAAPPPLYHPTRVGDRWVLKGDDLTLTQVVTAVTPDPGGRGYTVAVGTEDAEGVVRPCMIMAVSDQGVYRVAEAHRIRQTPPVCVLKPPKGAGAWTFVSAGTAYEVRGTERVRTPAGTFEALRVVATARRADGTADVWTRWYAPRVGLVKQKTDLDTWTLQSFTPGKD